MVKRNSALISLGVAILFFFLTISTTSNPLLQSVSGPENDSVVTVTLTSAGDLMCHSGQFETARIGQDSFDFRPSFRFVKEYLSKADIAIGNFETTLAGKSKPYSGYPLFNSPDEFGDAVKDAGFDLLTLSNNHCIDKGEAGLKRTIETLNGLGMHTLGAYLSPADRDSFRILTVKGIRFGFLAYTYGLNGNKIAENKSYMVSVIDTNVIGKNLRALRSSVDIAVVYFHFGDEYKRYPNQYQKNVVDCAVRNGCDIVLGGHPHVLQPVTYFATHGATLDTGLCIYSLGNFISAMKDPYTEHGCMLSITLEKRTSDNTIKISSVEAIPTQVKRSYVAGKAGFYIIPSTCKEDLSEYKFRATNGADDPRLSFEQVAEILQAYTKQISVPLR